MNRSVPTRRDPRVALMAQLDALQGQPAGAVLTVDGRHRLTMKHPTKVLWPQLGLTTVDAMRYYVRVAPVLLPHVKDRPLSFRRFARGIDEPSQFHQRIKWPTPPGVRTASFAAKAKQFETRLIGGDLTTLLYCVSLAIISQDVWLSRLEQPDRPDYAVFDLDPSPACRLSGWSLPHSSFTSCSKSIAYRTVSKRAVSVASISMSLSRIRTTA